MSVSPQVGSAQVGQVGVPIKVIAAAGGWGVMEVIAQGRLGLHSIGDVKTYVRSGKPKLKVGTLQGDTIKGKAETDIRGQKVPRDWEAQRVREEPPKAEN